MGPGRVLVASGASWLLLVFFVIVLQFVIPATPRSGTDYIVAGMFLASLIVSVSVSAYLFIQPERGRVRDGAWMGVLVSLPLAVMVMSNNEIDPKIESVFITQFARLFTVALMISLAQSFGATGAYFKLRPMPNNKRGASRGCTASAGTGI